jgi:hypothetical protein
MALGLLTTGPPQLSADKESPGPPECTGNFHNGITGITGIQPLDRFAALMRG